MNKKKIVMDFSNPEARMKLTVKGNNAINQAIKISKTFDEACKEIRNKKTDLV